VTVRERLLIDRIDHWSNRSLPVTARFETS
jgi:hypothetical protein